MEHFITPQVITNTFLKAYILYIHTTHGFEPHPAKQSQTDKSDHNRDKSGQDGGLLFKHIEIIH